MDSLENEQLAALESKITELQNTVTKKMDLNQVEQILSDFVSKSEIQDLLPDQEALENKIQSIVEMSQDELWEKVTAKLKVFDQRITTIRNEFDMNAITQLINSKASQD